MIISKSAVVHASDVSKFSWSGLKRFYHVPSVADTLMILHSVPEKHRGNVTKQATQIRQCLIQAREYADAAAVTTLATKPLLLYYSVMSLALAQILFKGSGKNSLDAARGEHAHHGLIFSTLPLNKGAYHFVEHASSLIARPMMTGADRRGTFELWHRLSREDPVICRLTQRDTGGQTVDEAHVLFTATDQRMGYLPEQGMSFYDCILGCPGMYSWLNNAGFPSHIVRATMEVHVPNERDEIIRLTVHPTSQERLNEFSEGIIMHPSYANDVSISEFYSGFSIQISQHHFPYPYINFPPSTSWTAKDLRFIPQRFSLNEFGYLYTGLYMLGNYARYHPDKWMTDVESGTLLSLAAEEFALMALERMALLTLSDLSRSYHILK